MTEAEQAAELMFQNHHKMPLVFAPQSDFGKRAAAAFEARWEALANEYNSSVANAATYFYSKDVNYKNFLGKALKTDVSRRRAEQIKNMSATQLKALAKNRGNADGIYIVGKRSNIIFFKSFMSVVVNPYAKKIPLYASSRSHEMDLTNTQDKELEGLTFSDVSFLVNEDGEVNKKIQSIWPKQRYSTLRLFALGYDGYSLIDQLKHLQVIEGYQYQGLVGDLSLDNNNTINSRLTWATYDEDGTLIEVTTPTSIK